MNVGAAKGRRICCTASGRGSIPPFSKIKVGLFCCQSLAEEPHEWNATARINPIELPIGFLRGFVGKIGFILLTAAVLCLRAEESRANEKIVWAALDFPPFEILSGDYLGTGSFDGLLTTLIKNMNDYDHEVVPMTFARRDEELTAGNDFCTPGIFRTPSRVKQGWLFSLPSLLHLDNRVIMLHKTGEKLTGSGPVDLDGLFSRTDMVGGIMAGRSFAPNIDAEIERHKGAKNLLVRAMKSEQFFQMLLAGEVDYVILFPHEAAYLAKRFNAEGQIMNRPIAGTPPYIFTHAACSNSAWGRRAMARINAIIKEERGKPGYRALSERWYDSADKAKVQQNYPDLLKAE